MFTDNFTDHRWSRSARQVIPELSPKLSEMPVYPLLDCSSYCCRSERCREREHPRCENSLQYGRPCLGRHSLTCSWWRHDLWGYSLIVDKKENKWHQYGTIQALEDGGWDPRRFTEFCDTVGVKVQNSFLKTVFDAPVDILLPLQYPAPKNYTVHIYANFTSCVIAELWSYQTIIFCHIDTSCKPGSSHSHGPSTR